MNDRILLTGATGFIGSHVHPALVRAGFDVVCASRKPDEARAAHPDRRWVALDLDDPGSVATALRGVHRAVYLAHGMGGGDDYADVELREARCFREAAENEGLQRVVYLGGMQPRGKVSPHLASRLHTGMELRAGALSVVELRATMVIGGGSESFRIVRDLAARLPWMLLPRWLGSVSEPVAVDDIAAAIVRALELELRPGESRVYDAPGPDRISGREILMRLARLLGHEPRVVSIPIVTPRLSSYWIRLVTRANPHLATELVEGLRSDIVATRPTIWEEMPEHRRLSFDEAARTALSAEEQSLGTGQRLVEGVLHRFASA